MATAAINSFFQFGTELAVYNLTAIGDEVIQAGGSAPSLVITTPDGYVITFSPDTIDVFLADAVSNMDVNAQTLPFVINEYYVEEQLDDGIMVDSEAVEVTTMPWTVFPDGVYEVTFTFETDEDTYTNTVKVLLLFSIRKCIAARALTALTNACADCTSTTDRDLGLMTAFLDAVELDFFYGDYSGVATKLLRLQNLCTSNKYCC